jgi:3-hydroxyisobutyrate dehydrogenase
MLRGDVSLGYMGLGLMGWAMTERLLSAGYATTVWNRSREKVVPAVKVGAAEARTPAEVARAADVVFLCVTDHRAVEEIVFGQDGVVQGASKDKILIDCSTIKPEACRQMAKRLRDEAGMAWIDAPVTGGLVGARAGRLVVMAGGYEADIERVRPIMAAVAQSFTYMGPQGAGLATKLCNQVVVACNKVVLSEMLLLARAGGIDGKRLPEVLKGGSADSFQMQREVPRMVEHDFEHPHGTAHTILKDLNIIRDFAQQAGTAMPVTALVNELFRLHIAGGNGDRDSTSIFEVLERQRKA